MAWFFLGAFVSARIGGGIGALNIGPKRRKPPRVTAGDADAGKKDR